MSEKTEKIQSAYIQLSESEGGKHLIDWLTTTAQTLRKKAIDGRVEYELGQAEGLDLVVEHINTWRNATKIGR